MLKIIINLLIKAECWVAGVGSLLLAIFAILALVNKVWLQLGIFALLFISGAVIMLMSVHILFWIDILKELVEKPGTDKHIRTNEKCVKALIILDKTHNKCYNLSNIERLSSSIIG